MAEVAGLFLIVLVVSFGSAFVVFVCLLLKWADLTLGEAIGAASAMTADFVQTKWRQLRGR